MTFVQREFPIFLLIVFSLNWGFQLLLPRLFPGRSWAQPRVWQNVMFAITSAVFYGWVHPWFLILLVTSATVDYFAAVFIEDHPHQKRGLLFVSLATNLGMLGYFKYWNFFVENFKAAADLMGLTLNLSTLQIILPVGISFYTFQTMSYVIDVYRGDMKATRSYLDYFVFVIFFPHLVAGPINRAHDLLKQVSEPRKWDFDRLVDGVGLMF